jgi:hypothetical protein
MGDIRRQNIRKMCENAFNHTRYILSAEIYQFKRKIGSLYVLGYPVFLLQIGIGFLHPTNKLARHAKRPGHTVTSPLRVLIVIFIEIHVI